MNHPSEAFEPNALTWEPMCGGPSCVPSAERVPSWGGPELSFGADTLLPPEHVGEVLIHAIHDGTAAPVELRSALQELAPARYAVEKDWGARRVAASLCRYLGLQDFVLVRLARFLLDFGRFPGVSPRGAEHLHRLAIPPEVAEVLTWEARELLLRRYDEISRVYESAILHPVQNRPRRLIIGIHTYDPFNAEGTLRPPLSLLSRSLTFHDQHTMHPGEFDPLYPDAIAELTADRCLTAGMARLLERDNVGVSDNHPYLLPDGGLEVRSQVWFFFRWLYKVFCEARFPGVASLDPDELPAGPEKRVWRMLLDTNLRNTDSAELRSHLHRYRRPWHPGGEVGPDPFAHERAFYFQLRRFVDEHQVDLAGRPVSVVDAWRLSPVRPSSMVIEIRKDLIWRFECLPPHGKADLAAWQRARPRTDEGAGRTEEITTLTRLIARAIRAYLTEDAPEKARNVGRDWDRCCQVE